MAKAKKTVSAKASENLRNRIETYQKENNFENKTDAVRELWREGLKADEIRQENAQLRRELEELQERERQSIRLPRNLTLIGIAWLAAILVLDGAGIVSFQLAIGTEAVGIVALASIAAYAVYQRYKSSTDES